MKNYAFVDMHIHTALSDEEDCILSVKETFDKAIEEKERYNLEGKMFLSICDHNSSLSAIEAKEILKDPKYSEQIDFINGIEFTTNLRDLPSITDKKIFTRCHMLAYNYDETEPNLLNYSKLTHKTFGECNLGQQIIALRDTWKKSGISIKFEEMSKVIEAKTITETVLEFFALLKTKCSDEQEYKALVDECKLFITYGRNRDAEALGRLKFLEVCELVKNAGGDLFVAHPSALKCGMTQIGYVKDRNQKYVLFNDFIETLQQASGNQIKGIECFYPDAHKSDSSEVLLILAQNKNLYVSAGSDYHGPILNRHRQPGECFNYYFCDYLKKDRDNPQRYQIFVNSLGYLDQKYSKAPVLKQKFKLGDSDNKPISNSCFYTKSAKYTAYYRAFQKQNQNIVSIKTFKPQNIISIDDYVKNIKVVLEKYDKLVEKLSENSTEKYKLMLDLNLFISTITEAVDQNKKYIRRQTAQRNSSAKFFTSKFNSLKAKYSKLKAFQPGLIKQCEKDMQFYYNQTGKLAIDQFFEINL